MLRTDTQSVMPCHILYPKQLKSPAPCVLALHGHGQGVNEIIGLGPKGQSAYQKDFACRLVEQGFIVAAPEIAGFGQRGIDHRYLTKEETVPESCYHLASYALMLGGSALGLRVRDTLRLIDYLETVEDVDTTRLGVVGVSAGGNLAFYHACVDLRVTSCVISGFFGDWEYTLTRRMRCLCNFVPGIYRMGNQNDLAGLIAPRPLLIQCGDQDPYLKLEFCRVTVERAHKAWEAFGVPKRLETHFFQGGHEIDLDSMFEFLAKNLRVGTQL